MMDTILKEKIVLNDKLVVEEAKLKDNFGEKYTRLRVNREDAAGILLLNTDSNRFILTRQFRYAVAQKTEELLLEIIAGKIDKKADPIETAIRETMEETGYRVAKENIRYLASCFVSPGYSSECIYIYSATVTNADKVAKGGGLEEEHEHIEIVEIEKYDFYEMINKGEINDAKTYLAGLLVPH